MRGDNIRRALEDEGLPPEEIERIVADHVEDVDLAARAAIAGVPAIYRTLTWESIIEEEANAEAIAAGRSWAAGESKANGLFLWSEGYGAGKTMIAAAAVLQILTSRPLRVRWLDCSRLLTDLNLPFGNPQYEAAAAALSRPKNGEVIVLDDIDKLPATDRNIQPIFTLVNDCVGEETPPIITANRHLDALADDFGRRFGGAIASRLVGHCLDVEVAGRDRRLEP